MNPEQDIVKNEELRKNVGLQAELAKSFFPTEPYQSFRDRLHAVMEARDHRLKMGLFEQKGGALIGPSGAGKSRMVSEAIADFHRVAEATGGREFGHHIVSVIVPGRATPKETAAEILRTLGYPVKNARDEDYFLIESRTS
ncbi:MAG: AAA family ATPase [Loktanella sp.]|nr:AAA family ATPase [Loktanella sp.]